MIVENVNGFVATCSAALGSQATYATLEGDLTIVGLWDGSTETPLTAPQQATVDAIFAGHNTLAVTTDKTTITADDADTATISCADGAISGDVDVLINVWLNGEIYAANVVDTLVGGVSTSTLSTNQVGTYLIEIRRNTGTDFETGYVEIEAI